MSDVEADQALTLLAQKLIAAGETVGVAESLTGGRLAAAITGVPGASAYFLGGVVSYATRIKVDVLGVPEALVAQLGVVSAPCAEAMATGVRDLLGCTWAVATTGVAGPERQEGHPPGTVFVAVAGADGAVARRLELAGDRAEIQRETCLIAIQHLVRVIH